MAQQMLLGLAPQWTPGFDNFVPGDNAELLSRLRGLADPHVFDRVYLWGAEGCGKSHLLDATARSATVRRPVMIVDGLTAPADLTARPGTLVVIDDVQHLSADAQIGVFRLFNAAPLIGLALLIAGPCPPRELALREDLRTRIGQCLVQSLHPLSDEDKAATLQRHAAQRGMKLDAGVLQYLLRHGRRDLPSLMATLDALDRTCLEQKRAPTLPLLRELMQTHLPLDTR